MSHLEADTLWALARKELEAGEQAAAQSHLEGCAECRASLEDITVATSLLAVLPEPPPMPEAMARRVGHSLADAADQRAAQRFTSWWSSFFTPRFVLAAAFGVVLVTAAAWWLAAAKAPAPTPIALPTPQEAVVPRDVPPEIAPQPLVPAPPARKLSVTVASARKSTTQKAQVLAEGASVSTQSGGSVWLKLPDGSRAGLTGASEVTLATLEEKALTLDIAKGSLAMVVPHREDRVLTVRAGDVVVRDLGTRFLVSREPSRTLVAVEEGVVAVQTPQGEREVRAGNAVSWSNGTLTELDWEPSPPPVAVAPKPVPPQPEKESVARLDEEDEDDDEPPPPEDVKTDAPPETTPVGTDEDWARPPPPSSPTGTVLRPTTVTTPSRERGFSLKKLERKLRAAGTRFTTRNRREADARNIAISADAGDCRYALELVDAWLKAPVTSAANEATLRRGVKTQQINCLRRLGRGDEADALQRQLDPLP